jgi:E3 ubiquitin-protein ligase ATL41
MSNFYGYRDHENGFNKIMLLSTIVSLALFLILMFALHKIYSRFNHEALRRAANGDVRLTATQAHTQLTEPPNTGLDPKLITTLPTFLFKQKQQEENNNVSNNIVECAVCLSLLQDEEMMRLLPNCKHSFHVGCIDKWLASHSTCPICRIKFEPRLEPEPREGPTFFEPPSECISNGGGVSGSPKDISALSSSRRILIRDRSSKRIQPSSTPHDYITIDHDLERQ